jgi:antitoxin component YwqK of YwqJK toxin-antitoxin module
MLRKLSFLLIILFANISFSQKNYKAFKTTISSDYNGEKVFKVKSGKPITGIVIEKYENDKIKYKGEFVKSLPTGWHYKYYESGRIKEVCNYLNGQLNGGYELYYDRGYRIKTKCNYKNGLKDGLYYELRDNGSDTIKKLFYVNGVLDGKAYYWEAVPSQNKDRKVWKLILIENYKSGIKDGFQEIYSSGYWIQTYNYGFHDEWIQGKGWEKILYKEGENIPYEIKDTSFYDNGEIEEINVKYYDKYGVLSKNTYSGFSSGLKTSEEIKEEVNNKFVKKIVTSRYWYKNGNISEENITQLKDDCPKCDWSFHEKNYAYEDSIIKKWYENGNLKYENYTDSLIKEWFENGTLKYENNLKNGFEIRKKENGQIEFEIIKNENGILSEKRYYPSGNIKYEYFKSIDGNGYEKWWNGNGTIECEGFFKKESKWDKKYWEGTFKIYEDERLISLEHYKAGEKSGIHKSWDKYDRLITEHDYDKGINIEYEWNNYKLFRERTTSYKRMYTEMVKSEVVKCWWNDGQNMKRYEYIYFDGKSCYEGIQKAWYNNGQLEYERNYKDCNPIGIHYEYHRNGRIYKKIEYRNGEVWEKRCYNTNGDSISCN